MPSGDPTGGECPADVMTVPFENQPALTRQTRRPQTRDGPVTMSQQPRLRVDRKPTIGEHDIALGGAKRMEGWRCQRRGIVAYVGRCYGVFKR